MDSTKLKKCNYFIGIDISKKTLDFAVLYQNDFQFHKVIANQPNEIILFLADLKKIKNFKFCQAIFGMENTGIYSNHLKTVLIQKRANFVIQSPLHLSNSFGIKRGKTDKMDAKRIAEHIMKSKLSLRFWQKKREIIDTLASLLALRSRLINAMLALKTPLKEDAIFVKKNIGELKVILCQDSVQSLVSDIENIEKYIKSLWSEDENLKSLMEIITSIPCVGEITALHVIISTNEFNDINHPKTFACYSGVAPFPYTSGTSVNKRTRVSRVANKKMKALLHACAMGSVRFIPEIKEYYIKKTKNEGKSKMSVINAVRFKLIGRIFSCVNNRRLYSQSYNPRSEHSVTD
jgi:transposase